ncbi:hypothetical protein LUZ60_014526 [Juncus effusus]|nr:hypothetical protein LUZ60_014526 [Juncus effusus]
MAKQSSSSSSPFDPSISNPRARNHCQTLVLIFLIFFLPIIISLFLYQPLSFNPAPLPHDYSYEATITIPTKHNKILELTERIGDGFLEGPEDLAYESETRYLYTGCADGWIKRINLVDDGKFEVENWVRIGEHSRPLGVVLGLKGELIVADAYEGLLKVNPDKTIELLTKEAEGVKFGLTDCLDVANDGTIYFTDASYKYNLENYMLDTLEGRPYGRLMSFNLSTNQTVVLVRDLYFANGVSMAPDQNSLIFCETPLRRCKRYHIQGEKKGTVENFVENLPGLPDNIRYDGESHYWIALLTEKRPALWDVIFKYPILRKILYIIEQFVTVPKSMKNSGVLSVTLDGQPVALYSDPALDLTTSGLKIGNFLYYGSLYKSYISRIDLTKIEATHDE